MSSQCRRKVLHFLALLFLAMARAVSFRFFLSCSYQLFIVVCDMIKIGFVCVRVYGFFDDVLFITKPVRFFLNSDSSRFMSRTNS